MTTTTPFLGLVLYDSSGDQAATFATWRAVIDGPATTSNFYKIDTAYGVQAAQITSLQATRGATPVASIFQSANLYAVTGITAITAYTTGMTIILSVDLDSSGTVTLNINSLGIKSVMKTNSSGAAINLTGSDLNAGRYYLFMYDGTRWMWVSANSADQINIDGTSGNVLTVNTDNTILGTLTQSLLISQTVNSATAKTTLADADLLGLVDSAASNVLKKITWANIATAMGVKWGTIINALTGKTTPVDADEFALADSAASYATKKLTWANIKATLLSIFQPKDGWIADSNTWTYSSIDSPTAIISVNADVTASIQKGTRLKLTQSQALTAYFPFDANSTSTVGSFTSTDTSMTYTSGKFSNAATFNGTTGKIVVTDTALLKPTGEFTIGMWIKSSTVADQILFQSRSVNTSNAGFMVYLNATGKISMRIGKNTGTTEGVDQTTLNGTINVADGIFHYVVVVFRNNYVQVYLDGVLEVSGYSFAPAYAATNYVRIGCSNSTGSDSLFFNGQIDDIFLINGYALDASTIYNQYIANIAQGTSNINITKNFITTNVGAYSGGVTLLTTYGGTDFSLANATISTPYYSGEKVPFGFNGLSTKWTVILTDISNRSQATPVTNTWYNLGSISMDIPIGSWIVSYKVCLRSDKTAATLVNAFSTLSTANNSESDPTFTNQLQIGGASGSMVVQGSVYNEKILSVSSKTTYYLNSRVTTAADNLNNRNDVVGLFITYQCVYL